MKYLHLFCVQVPPLLIVFIRSYEEYLGLCYLANGLFLDSFSLSGGETEADDKSGASQQQKSAEKESGLGDSYQTAAVDASQNDDQQQVRGGANRVSV